MLRIVVLNVLKTTDNNVIKIMNDKIYIFFYIYKMNETLTTVNRC